MEFTLRSPAGGELLINENFTGEHVPHKLPTSQTHYVEGNFGRMYFHHVACPDFSIWKSVYDIEQPTTLTGKADMPLLEIHGSVENSAQASWEGFDTTVHREDQYNLSYVPYVDNTVSFHPGKRFRTLDFHVSPSLLQPFASSYPALEQFLNRVEQKKPAQLFANDFIITGYMRDCLDRIGDYTTQPATANFFYDAKVKEFLVMLLDQASLQERRKAGRPKFTTFQVDATHAARELLTADLAKPPTIAQLARQVHLNECTLKKCFRHLFNSSIHQYFIQERMKMAKRLLLDGSFPIEDIWIMLGYSDKQNFYTDFKKRVGKTPDQWCRENGVNRKGFSAPD